MGRPECEATRQTIIDIAEWFDNLENMPTPSDADYEERMARLSLVLNDSDEAFEARPNGCQMSKRDCAFVCKACDFYIG